MAEDQIEKALKEVETKLRAAWTNNRCLTCPLAELAALAAATYMFYVESKRNGGSAPLRPL